MANPKKILIVDDDRDIREIISLILESEFYEVAALDRGQAVLDTVLEVRPAMVFLGVQLGDMDGRDICRELKFKSDTQAIPVIMISASHGWPGLYEKHCRADDFLAKAFNIGDLVNYVKRYAA